jgi:transposase
MMEMTDTHVILTKEEFGKLTGQIEAYLALLAKVDKLENRVKELEAQLGKNSGNSSKPPSSDGYRKAIKNNREKSDKNQGAQEGHKGTTLQMVDAPDKVLMHKVEGICSGCGKDLQTARIKDVQRRQVFDLPEKLMEVTEHQVEIRECQCGILHQAPCVVNASAQYGNRFKALMVYLSQYQYMPFERLQEFSEDCFGMSISDGALVAGNQMCYDNLEENELHIKEQIIQSEVIHNDETGIRCEGKTKWVHSSSTQNYTHYSLQDKRGKEAINDIGILPDFKGISVHDRWASYNEYDCGHALCNAHLLRDLKFLAEELHIQWAPDMIALLVKANQFKKEGLLHKKIISGIENQSRKIIKQGLKEEPLLDIKTIPQRGRKAKSKSLNLLNVFIERSDQVWAFIHNQAVPFDNNLAERDLRMVKLKQKISGCFRSINGGKVFCRIRSYISTARKQRHSILFAIESAIVGNPISL